MDGCVEERQGVLVDGVEDAATNATLPSSASLLVTGPPGVSSPSPVHSHRTLTDAVSCDIRAHRDEQRVQAGEIGPDTEVAAGEDAEDMDESKYSEDGLGLRVEHISVEECAFLYQEIFVRRAYMKHATLQEGGGDILDVGANIGLFALFCRQQLSGFSDKIYAFEPVEAINSVLGRNLSDVEGTFVCRYGLGAFESASETFVYYPDTPGESSRQLAESAAQRKIMGIDEVHGGRRCHGEIRRLSGVVRQHGISRVQLLKVDVEGDELLVLLGIEDEDWHIFQQVVLEVHDVEHRLARVTALLQRRGFKVIVEQQTSEWDDGSLLLVPLELRLYYVHAIRANC